MKLNTIKYMRLTQIPPELLAQYRNNEITFDGLAKELKVWRPLLTKYFKDNNIKTNRDLKKESIKHNIFSNIDTEQSAYLLGLFVADGSMTSSNFMFSLSLSEKDKELLKTIHEELCPNHCFLRSEGKINADNSVSKPMYKICFKSKQIYTDLLALNLPVGQKTYSEINIPKLSDERIWDFIRGYFDGDGTLVVSKGIRKDKFKYFNVNLSFVAKTKTLLSEIQALFDKEEIKSTLFFEPVKEVFYLRVSNKSGILKIKSKLYDNKQWYLKRKYNKFMEIPS